MLHELCWEPPEEMTRNHTEEEIAELKKKLGRRGGSKIETVHEIIRRKKWRMRAKIIMDQKANSVADLAAVLLEHDQRGTEAGLTEASRLAAERDTILALARDFDAGAPREALVRRIAEGEATLLPEVGASKKLRAAIASQNRKTAKKVDAAKVALKRMEWSHAVVLEAIEALPEPTASDGTASSEPPRELTFQENLEERGDEIKEALPRMPLEFVDKEDKAPIYSSEGVTVQWANVLDAEFAEAWPNAVKHEAMGLFRNTPPAAPGATATFVKRQKGKPKQEVFADGHPIVDAPVYDLGSLRTKGWKRRGIPAWLNEGNMGAEGYKEAAERNEVWATQHGLRTPAPLPFTFGKSASTAAEAQDDAATPEARLASLEKLNKVLVKRVNRAIVDNEGVTHNASKMPRASVPAGLRARFQEAMDLAQDFKKESANAP